MSLVAAMLAVTGCSDILGSDDGGYPRLWVQQTAVVLHPGEEATLSARVRRSADELVTDASSTVWSAASSEVVSVQPSGLVTALSPGVAVVWAEVDEARDSLTLVVREPTSAPATRWMAVEAGEGTTCALDVDGLAYCWGSDYFGEVGDGVRRKWTSTYAPVAVAHHRRFAEIDVGRQFACARTPDGEAYCWGSPLVVASHPGDEEPVLEPRRVPFSQPFASLQVGEAHICGLTETGKAYCWGVNAHGEIGDGTAGTSNHRYAPTLVETDARFRQIEPGHYQTCGVGTDDQVHCWGGVDRNATLPEALSGGEFRMIAGPRHVCGILFGGEAVCWGPNGSRELGNSGVSISVDPVPVQGEFSFSELAAGLFASCGIDSDGAAYCWGSNWKGNLGVGDEPLETCSSGGVTIACTSTPTRVAGGLRFASISMSTTTSCGIDVDQALYCWGSNEHGQLGIGSLLEGSPVPVRVADPVP